MVDLRGNGLTPQQAGHGQCRDFHLLPWAHGHNPLVEVAVKGEALHVLVIAHFHEGLTGCIVGVEHPLQDVQNLVGGPIAAIPLAQVGPFHLSGRGDALALLTHLHQGLGAHAATLGGKVNALTGTLGHITGGIAHQAHLLHHPARARVLRDGMGFHLDHLAAEQALAGPLADAPLQGLDQGLVFLHGAGAHRHVVVLGKHPGVKVGGHIGAHVHLRQILVVGHFLPGQADPLLKGNGHLVGPRIHGLGHPGVGPVRADDVIHLQGLAITLEPGTVGGVTDGVGAFALGSGGDGLHQAVDQGGAILRRPIAQEGIKNLPTAHANELILAIPERVQTNVHFLVGRGNHPHIANLAVNDVAGEVKFLHHAEGNCATTGLGIVQLALKQPGFDSSFGQHFRSTGPTGASADNGNAQHDTSPRNLAGSDGLNLQPRRNALGQGVAKLPRGCRARLPGGIIQGEGGVPRVWQR